MYAWSGKDDDYYQVVYFLINSIEWFSFFFVHDLSSPPFSKTFDLGKLNQLYLASLSMQYLLVLNRGSVGVSEFECECLHMCHQTENLESSTNSSTTRLPTCIYLHSPLVERRIHSIKWFVKPPGDWSSNRFESAVAVICDFVFLV
jgi:hypothetical protein